jgi:hypothetical protein
MGYDFAAAVADLVDNSIEARATMVAIDVEFDGDDSWVRIADNGVGMTPPQLREALRYGADREYDETDLGKFGLGLKTASFSQCQRLTVASRTNPNRRDITAFCWDLDHIDRTNRWEILAVERNGLGPAIRAPLKETRGTVVLWQRLDRILGYKHPYGETARKRLGAMCRELEEHLAMVFHRFLSGEVRGRRLKILINGNPVTPWDPFARDEPKIRELTPIRLSVEHEGVSGEVTLEPYVLPHQQDFSSPDAFRRASGPSNWNQQQGFYIYRAGRLIQSGGWCRLRTIDEHTKLARIALSFLPALDEAFKINVAKMRVQLPPQIRDQIEQAVGPVVRIALERYRKRSAAAAGSASRHVVTTPGPTVTALPATAPDAVAARESPGEQLVARETEPPQRLWPLDELQQQLERVAEPAERPILAKVFNRFRSRVRAEGGIR